VWRGFLRTKIRGVGSWKLDDWFKIFVRRENEYNSATQGAICGDTKLNKIFSILRAHARSAASQQDTEGNSFAVWSETGGNMYVQKQALHCVGREV